MKKLVAFLLLLDLLILVAPANATTTIYVDDDAMCEGNSPCYEHPQDAVNAAAPGDTILVYPGTYGSRYFECGSSACSPNDNWAPALIVYKDRITIRGVGDSSAVIIESTHLYWSNPIAVENSTGNQVITPFGSAPNAVSVIANGVTLENLTFRRPNSPASGGHENVQIGGLYAGYGTAGERVGFSGNTVRNSILGGGDKQSRSGVLIWHSSDNRIENNTVVDPFWTAISVYDGFTNSEVSLPSSSTGNHITGNRLQDDPATASANSQCVFVGAWNEGQPGGIGTNNRGTLVRDNDCAEWNLFTAYSEGNKVFVSNTHVNWSGAYLASDYHFVGKVWVGVPPGMEHLRTGRGK